MFSFAKTVATLLKEQDQVQNQAPQVNAPASNTAQPQNVTSNANKLLQDLYNSADSTFKNFKDTFDNKFGFKTDLNAVYTELNNTVPGGKYNIAAKYVNDTYIPFIDVFSLAVKVMTSDSRAEQKPTMVAILQNILKTPDQYNLIFNEASEQIAKLPDGSRPIDYIPTHPIVNRAANTLRNETEKLAQTAVESLYSDTVFSSVSKIIAKRINVLDRITSLKGIRRPFSQSLIRPVLMSWRKYTSLGEPGSQINWEKALAPLYGHWQKKVSADFTNIVDGITADNLLTIAVLAGEYYLSLLRNVIVDSEAQSNENYSFNDIYNLIVNEDATAHKGSFSKYQQGYENVFSSKPTAAEIKNRVLKAVGQTRKGTESSKYSEKPLKGVEQENQTPEGATPLTAVEYDDIAKGLGDGEIQDYKDFIEKGRSRYLGNSVFNLGTISKDPSREAKALLNAIKGIAYHVRKGIGAGQVVKAVGALRVGMGPVN